MVLNAFDLTGKVAIVTGCDTGLGQGMTLGLAQAGCDIVGINRKIPHDTAAQVQALGRRFHAIQADLSQQDDMTVLVDRRGYAQGLPGCAPHLRAAPGCYWWPYTRAQWR